MLIEEHVGLRRRAARPKGSPLYGDRLPTAGEQPRLESNVRSFGAAGLQMSDNSGQKAVRCPLPADSRQPLHSSRASSAHPVDSDDRR